MDINLMQMLFGLIVAITVLVFLVLRTRVHAFPALIIAALIAGTVGGYGVMETLDSIKKGFGGTLGSIGIIIGFGVILGAVFEMSGAAKRMALTFIRLFGKGREEYALCVTGFIVSIPIFCDSAFIILSSLAKAISRNTGKSLTTLGVALASGLIVTHTLVPPTPGPLVVIVNFGIDIGSFLVWSLLLSIPMTLTMILYAQYVGKKVFRLPALEGNGFVSIPYGSMLEEQSLEDEIDELPSAFLSFLPIATPLLLIFLSTFLNALGHKSGEASGVLVNTLHNMGNPVIAVGLGLLIGLFTLTKKFSRQQVIDATDESIKQAGIIIFVTGGGGALGMVLRDSGSGDAIAQALVDFSIPAILLPIVIATLVRFIQGSGTVSLVTSSAIVAPVVSSGVIDIQPILAALGCCVGGLFFSYFNDSYFWVVNRTLGIRTTSEQIQVWSVTSTIGWGTGVIILLLINAVL
jgi:gluconate:H+ symporter, GntP family